MVCARLGRAEECRGCIAVQLDEADARLSNPVSLDCVKVVAEQTVSLLDKQETIEERRRSEKQALLGSMLSTVVHDMKNPLSGITGFAQLIKRRVQDPKVHEFCDIILDSLTRVERMNSELLLFVRGGSLDLDRSVFSLLDFLQPLVNTMSVACQRHNITLDLECPRDLKIRADRNQLHRVFANLLANAREAIEKDGRIRVVVSQEEQKTVVSVEDTGKGMPGRVLEHIFEPFVSYGKKNGTGLGMSIAKSIVEKHDGTIQVRSMLGKGTTVIVALPASSAEAGLNSEPKQGGHS
jgi:two-component system, sporulation sensor kinase D